MNKKNGFLPGWPPFHAFKKEMVDLLEEVQKPVKKDVDTIKQSLTSHILKTNNHIKNTDKNFKVMNQALTSHIKKTAQNFKTINYILTNHVTDTDKKIDNFRKEVNIKLDTLLKKQ